MKCNEFISFMINILYFIRYFVYLNISRSDNKFVQILNSLIQLCSSLYSNNTVSFNFLFNSPMLLLDFV